MNGRRESSLLRLAIARGLLRWEDLDAVSERLAADADTAPLEGRWIQALLDAGRLIPTTVAALSAELEHAEDLTPDLHASRSVSDLFAGREVSSPGARGETENPALTLPVEYRFLADWTRYRVERLLGKGGMGTVFKAFDPTLGRYVALKFLHRNDDDQAERFLREARAQARIAHPHVCQVHEVGEVSGRPFIAMQYIDGRNLGELGPELPLVAKLRVVRDVARAVHAAHKTGLIHRDLKPANILLARDEAGELHPFVVDFGLALEQGQTGLSRTGVISGTPAYLSPEQAQGQTLDRRTDVYSLGVVLYELLTGVPPFEATNLARVLIQVVLEEPKTLRQVDPSLPEDLETLVAKCLEKDSARRYETARDLAEDLDRFLDGEPIQARPAGWSYRAGKRLRKNRALAWVSVAAVLALTVLGALSFRALLRARERAELAQRFGQRIGELESSMTYEAFLPPHDITPHKRRLRAGLETLRSEMSRLGEIARGPGNFALGQGDLALHQYERARTHLERAWQAGERSPELALALGRTLAALYERTLADVSRETSRDEIERHYRLPALAYLRASGSAPPSSPYAAALLALFEGRYAAAKAAAREARRQNPRFYEAGQLEAEISMAQGNEASNGGRYEEALALYGQAGEVYRDLLRQVPSEAGLYGGDCERRARQLDATILSIRRVPADQVKEALAACDLALAVDPELTDAVMEKASIFWRRGEQKAAHGENPEPDLATSIELAERALATDPRNARTYTRLAAAHRVLAQWELGHGGDPTGHAQKGIDAAKKAVEIQPGLPSAHSGLGTAYLLLVLIEQRRGTDPSQAVEQAAASYRRALKLDPKLMSAQINQGNAWKAMAEVQVARGVDPSISVGRAVAAFERAALLNPSYPPVYNNLGNIHLTLGEYLLTRGSDPRQALTTAAERYEKAVALKPDYSLARFNLGYTYRSLAAGLLEQGQDPGPALAAADAALTAYLRLNPTDADTFLEQARVRLVAARWDLKRKTSPARNLDQADADLLRAAKVNPQYPDVFFTQAQVARCRAEATADPRLASAVLHTGLDRLAQALAVTPGEGRYLALQGLLEYRASGLEPDAERRQERARRAVAALEGALQANPLLEHEYGSVLAEARSAAGGRGPAAEAAARARQAA
jgi:predicted Ser/Thr protein kinase